MSNSRLPPALFHYTVGPKLAAIQATGALNPSGYGLALSRRERPVLWWSEHAEWDPTATKVMSADGGKTFRRPALRELHAAAGLFRFRLDTRSPQTLRSIGLELLPWPRIANAARIDAAEVASMVLTGVRLGATPVHWVTAQSGHPVIAVRVSNYDEARPATAGRLGPDCGTRYILSARAKPSRRRGPVVSNVGPKKRGTGYA